VIENCKVNDCAKKELTWEIVDLRLALAQAEEFIKRRFPKEAGEGLTDYIASANTERRLKKLKSLGFGDAADFARSSSQSVVATEPVFDEIAVEQLAKALCLECFIPMRLAPQRARDVINHLGKLYRQRSV
jgi:hypothetical protein